MPQLEESSPKPEQGSPGASSRAREGFSQPPLLTKVPPPLSVLGVQCKISLVNMLCYRGRQHEKAGLKMKEFAQSFHFKVTQQQHDKNLRDRGCGLPRVPCELGEGY